MLILAESSIPYINNQYAAVPIERQLVGQQKFGATVEYGLYNGVLMVAQQRRDRKTGGWGYDPKAQIILDTFNYEVIGETVVDPLYRMQIVKVGKAKVAIPLKKWPEYNAEESGASYARRVYELMPSLIAPH